MAEGFGNDLYGDMFEAYGAGAQASRVNPLAIEVMKGIGIDTSHHESKGLEGFLDKDLDCVIIVCDDANERCAFFPGRHKRRQKGFEDPGAVTGTDEEKVEFFRRGRDQIRQSLEEELRSICGGANQNDQ